MTQTLSVFQSLWAMRDLPWRAATPWSLEESIQRAASAGFAGVAIDTYSPDDVPPAARIAPALRAAGLRVSVTVFVTESRPLTDGLAYAHEVGAELELALDLSHYVVGNELPGSDDARVDGLIETLLWHGASLQGRVATREQVQVPLEFAQHRPAVRRFRRWWSAAFRSWRERAANDADCVFLCELGPAPYPITGPDGQELSDRWREALLL